MNDWQLSDNTTYSGRSLQQLEFKRLRNNKFL